MYINEAVGSGCLVLMLKNGVIIWVTLVTAKITILIKDKYFRLRDKNQTVCFVSSKEPSYHDSSL